MKYFPILILLFSVACDSNDCDDVLQGETLVISDTTRTFISNYENTATVVFEDQQNQEVRFSVSERSEIFASTTRFEVPCEDDPNQNQLVATTTEFIEVTLVNQEDPLADTIFVALVRQPTSMENSDATIAEESVIITSGRLFGGDSTPLDQEDILLTYDADESNVNILDSLVINGRSFFSVYEPENIGFTPTFDVRYTLDEGIVMLRDNATGVDLTYLRTE